MLSMLNETSFVNRSVYTQYHKIKLKQSRILRLIYSRFGMNEITPLNANVDKIHSGKMNYGQ